MALPPLEIRVTADTASAEAGLKRVDTQMNKTAARTATYGRSAQAAAGNTANLAAQFNDIGVMLASGQSPLLLAVQQGTQINQVMGQMGTTGASRVQALGTAFMSIISPANLATLGIIAGGAALVQWATSAFQAGGDTDDLADAIEGLNEIVDRSDNLIDILSSSVEELNAIYLTAANRTREFAAAQAELLASQTERRLADQLNVLNSELDRFIATNDELSRGKTGFAAQATALAELQRSFGVTSEQAVILQGDLRDLAEAGDFEGQVTALEQVLATLEDMGVPLSDIPPELQLAIDEMITLVRETDKAKAAMDQLSASAAGVSIGIPLFDQGFSGPQLLPPGSTKEPSKRRGGGRRGPDPEKQRQRELQSFIESLQTERETLEAWREEQMELLAQFNDAELEAIGGHNEARLRLEQEYQERLRGIQQMGQQQYLSNLSGLFGNMAAIMQAGGEKTTKIAKAFAIAEGLINSYRAYLQVLADPSLTGRPFLRTALAASTLAAGLAQVANIRSVNTSGTSSGGAGAGGAGAGAGVVNTQRVDLNIIGGTDRDRAVAQEIISVLNNAQRDGFRLDPRLIGGT